MGAGEVSVRELRQNLSVHLRRVQHGETLAVTSRGHRVAVLAPIGAGTRLDRLMAEGRVTGPELPWVDPELVSVAPARPGPGLTQVLLEQRAQEDR